MTSGGNIERVRAFIAAWEACDVDRICALAAPDIHYHNIPMAPIEGREALRAFASPLMTTAERARWEVLHIAETEDGAVLTERLDEFFMPGGKVIAVRVMGTFEFNDAGEVARWRDYFDLAEFQSQMA